jgi:thiosulfate/3-mercaptopyruvate sulfurtransferase
VAAFDGTLIDVRAPERYRGEVEPIDPKAGHIPGAVNRPVGGYWTAEGTLPDDGELRGLLALPDSTIPEEGAERPSRRVAVYCGSGVSAAQVVLALASVGVDAALYPPSWSGWSADPSRPVAVGPQE